jgi:tetratricopeptide (TPR) repeat protein
VEGAEAASPSAAAQLFDLPRLDAGPDDDGSTDAEGWESVSDDGAEGYTHDHYALDAGETDVVGHVHQPPAPPLALPDSDTAGADDDATFYERLVAAVRTHLAVRARGGTEHADAELARSFCVHARLPLQVRRGTVLPPAADVSTASGAPQVPIAAPLESEVALCRRIAFFYHAHGGRVPGPGEPDPPMARPAGVPRKTREGDAIVFDPAESSSWNDLGVRIRPRDRVQLKDWGSKAEAVGSLPLPRGGLYRRVDCFLRAVALAPQAATAWLNLGLALDGSHKIVRIGGVRYGRRACLVRALELQPTLGAAWLALGLDLARAVKVTSPAPATTDDDGHTPDVIAALSTEVVGGTALNALDCLGLCALHAPGYSAAWYALGTLMLHLGVRTVIIDHGAAFDAANCLYRSLLLDPGQAHAWHHLALALPSRDAEMTIFGRRYRQRDCLAQALSLNPRLEKAWCALYLLSDAPATPTASPVAPHAPVEGDAPRFVPPPTVSCTGGGTVSSLRVRGYAADDRARVTSARTALTAIPTV